MEEDPDSVDRFVEDLLQDRRPERTPLADADALWARQVAAMLRGAKPGAGLPTADFLHRMESAVAGWVKERGAPAPGASRVSRRALILSGLGGLAAGIAAVLGFARVTRPAPGQPGGPAVANEVPLVVAGEWKPVATLASLPEGTAVRFGSGAIEGFLIRQGTAVRALSAICTHMGCLLNWSTLRTRFECPCHGAVFAASGAPLEHYRSGLRPLPALQVRVNGEQVEVFIV